MNILALNPGSSTLKFARYRGDALIDKGMVEVTDGMGKAAADVIARAPVDAIGCRVVHGGARFVAPTVVDDAVLREIIALAALAPLHNPLAVEVLTAAREACSRVVAVFDTAFHQTLPEVAFTYAVPRDLGMRILWAHLQDAPPHPSDVQADVPRPVGDAILLGLAKEPGERPQSASELMRLVEIAAGPPPAPDDLTVIPE